MAHPKSSFLTLTYDDENIPDGGNLRPRDLQLFWKRLRNRIPEKIRYFACGEYGEKSLRPHYHAIVYNTDFVELDYFSRQIWDYGFIYSVPATPETASYVAGYVTKKISKFQDFRLEPEFIRCSRGIGGFLIPNLVEYALSQGEHDVIHEIKIGGKSYPLPDYIRRKMRELVFSDEYLELLKQARISDMRDYVIGLITEFLGDCAIKNSTQVLHANAIATKNAYLQIRKKDKIWNSRSKI